MSYSTAKGSQGERECAEFLNGVFKEFSFKFLRIGGNERRKKILAGDVVLDEKSDLERKCVLRPYFIEVKARENVQVFDSLAKAEEDAKGWGKFGAIGYFVKQARGSKGQRIIAMTPATFKKLIGDLQRAYEKDAKAT